MQTINQFSQESVQNLAQHIASLQKRLTELEARHETSNDRLVELAKASKERFDRVQSLLSHLDTVFKRSIQDLRLEVSKANGQLTQKRVADSKVERLFDDHSRIVSQFESRLQDLKRLIAAQDMKILGLDSRVKIAETLKR